MPSDIIEPRNPLKGNLASKCKVDIIIPFHGCYTYVQNLVESILLRTPTNEYKIILVDDGSPNSYFLTGDQSHPTQKYKGIINTPYCTGIRQQHLGFGSALYAGFKLGKNPYVCFLNSDTLVETPTWLSGMLNTFLELKNTGVQLVSARSDNPLSDIDGFKCDKYQQGKDKIVQNALPLFCAICKRDLFSNLGSFLPQYSPYGGYEDEWLFWAMKKKGFKQAISGKSWIKHYGETTINEICKKDPNALRIITEINREKCLQDISNF